MTQDLYWATIEIGHSNNNLSPQTFKVQVDTGSSSLWVMSQYCIDKQQCTTADNDSYYNAALSSTSSPILCNSNQCSSDVSEASCVGSNGLQGIFQSSKCCSFDMPQDCGFNVQYGGGTKARGSLVSDVISLHGIHSTVSNLANNAAEVSCEIVFGQVTEETDFTANDIDGILGLAYSSLDCTPSCVEPLFDTLFLNGKVPMNVISMCFGESTGVLVLGEAAPDLHVGEIVYTPITSENFYSVTVLDIKLNEDSIVPNGGNDAGSSNSGIYNSNEGYHAIVDSGTTFLLLRSSLYNSLITAFKTQYPQLVGSGLMFNSENCLATPPSSEWPVLEIYLNGATMSIPPSLYFYLQNEVSYCFGIHPLPPAISDIDIILGDTILRGYHTILDRENDRIGFAIANLTACGGLATGDIFSTAVTQTFLEFVERICVIVACVLVSLCVTVNACYCIYKSNCCRRRSFSSTYAKNMGESGVVTSDYVLIPDDTVDIDGHPNHTQFNNVTAA